MNAHIDELCDSVRALIQSNAELSQDMQEKISQNGANFATLAFAIDRVAGMQSATNALLVELVTLASRGSGSSGE